MNEPPSMPLAQFKVGAVKAAIWSNPRLRSDGKVFNSNKVVLDRTYKDKDGNFKSTNSFDTNDVPKAMLALNKAYEYLTTQNPEQKNGN